MSQRTTVCSVIACITAVCLVFVIQLFTLFFSRFIMRLKKKIYTFKFVHLNDLHMLFFYLLVYNILRIQNNILQLNLSTINRILQNNGHCEAFYIFLSDKHFYGYHFTSILLLLAIFFMTFVLPKVNEIKNLLF